MLRKQFVANMLARARREAGLSQRELAERAGTAQSVVARIELGETSPTVRSLVRLVEAAGFEFEAELRARPVLDPQELDDVPRILRLTPEDRLREVANVSRLWASARRV